MSKLLPWMVSTDADILQFIQSLSSDEFDPIPVSPIVVYINLNTIHDVTDKKRQTIARRMRLLNEMGLIDDVSETRGAYYTITDLGTAFLENEHDPSDLIPPEGFGEQT